MTYQHLLVAVDGNENCTALITKAQGLAAQFKARLSVLSVLPPLPIGAIAPDAGMGMPMMSSPGMEANWSKEMHEDLRRSLSAVCKPLGIADQDIHLVTDHIDSGIVDAAKQLQADLIVVGHHPRSGWFAALLSHTDQSVVGKTKCDVLVVVLDREH